MGRWKPDATGRLIAAALELYSERGYEQTTVAEIAKRAGLTERTFFRHFSDKREVLFWGAQRLEQELLRAVDAAPAKLSAFEAAGAGIEAISALLPERNEYSRQRQAVIDANPELQEREHIKLASLAKALAAALRRRGVKDSAAALTAETAVAVFRVAFERWIAESNRKSLPELIRASLAELKSLAR